MKKRFFVSKNKARGYLGDISVYQNKLAFIMFKYSMLLTPQKIRHFKLTNMSNLTSITKLKKIIIIEKRFPL